MNPIQPEALLQQLQWRYATKQFDSTKKIPANIWSALEDTLVLTPSSFGLQPWKFIVVTDPAVREKLMAVSWNQKQVVECSHHVVFAVQKENTVEHVDTYTKSIAQIRNLPEDSPALAGLKKAIVGYNQVRPNLPWNSLQAYIALGNFMTSAAMLGVDTCPMEGIDPAQYDEILGLSEKGLATAVACCAGYRASTDKYASMAKVRFKKSDLIVHV